MKSAEIGMIEERHYDCPYCGSTITDTSIFSQIDIEVDQIFEGVNECPVCKNKVLLK